MFWITCPCCKRKASSNTWKHDLENGSEICVYCRRYGCAAECQRSPKRLEIAQSPVDVEDNG